MECFFLALFLILLVVLLLGFGLGGTSQPRGAAAYEELAKSLGGRLLRPGWFTHPRLSFRYRSADALVGVLPCGLYPGDRGPVTQLQVEWPDAHFHLAVVHPPRPPRLSAGDGYYEWRSGRFDFDSLFSVRSSDPAVAKGMFSEVVQHLVERLRRMPRPGGLVVEIDRGVFRVAKDTFIRRPLDLQDFVRTALELYDQALLGSSEGIEFVDARLAQPLEHVLCSVCGEEIERDLVFCRRCKTPHHRDCWLYVGKCSVFGCGETEYQTPRRASRAVQQPADPAQSQE